MIDIFVEPTAALPLDQARALPIGLTAWIDASVLVDPSGARICDVGAPVGPVALESCPSDAPVAEHFAATPGEQLIWYGPILATRTAAGFDRVASGGGFGGVGL
jgi:hypothetical protein